jgi:hypothetical protein
LPTPNTALQALHDEYRHLAGVSVTGLTNDQRRGLSYYLAETGHDDKPERHVARWNARAKSLDEFVSREGHFPRADSHRPRAVTEEQTLVDVLAYFRQIADSFCTYQRSRLEAVPGFSWRPRIDAWQASFDAHQQFWATYGRAPRRRSIDHEEVRLGRWVALQRTLAGTGRIDPARERALRSAPFRVL